MSSPHVGEESSQPRSGKRKLTEQVESSEDKSLDEMAEKVNKSTQTEILYEESNYSSVYYQFP